MVIFCRKGSQFHLSQGYYRVAILPASFDNIIFLKSNKGGYYSGKIADVEENIEDDCDEPILISAFKKLLQVSMSNKEPLLNTTKENK